MQCELIVLSGDHKMFYDNFATKKGITKSFPF
jgi:hypothetical protein